MIQNSFTKPTLLVVDDTPDILHLVMQLLMGEYNLKLISNPKKALNFLPEFKHICKRQDFLQI